MIVRKYKVSDPKSLREDAQIRCFGANLVGSLEYFSGFVFMLVDP